MFHTPSKRQRSLGLSLGAAVVILTFASAGSAQSPEDRLRLQRLLDSLDRVTEAPTIRDLPGEPRSPLDELCEGLVQLRLGEFMPSRDRYDLALRRVEAALRSRPNWPWAWYQLGLTRSAMFRRGFVVKETQYQTAGVSYRRSAMDAYARASTIDSTFLLPAIALAGHLLEMEHRHLPGEFLAPLARVSTDHIPSSVLLALYRLDYSEGRYSDALTRLRNYLEAGGDSGLTGLEQARTLEALGHSSQASVAYHWGLSRLGEEGRLEFRSDLAWIATDEELAAFDSLPLPSVLAGPNKFWLERDALELRRPGERLGEHLRRWVYAHQHYLVYRPDDVPIHPEGLVANDQRTSGGNFGMVEAMVLNDLNTTLPQFKIYKRRQWELDDRGVIYLRHGQPTRIAIYPSGPPNESWQYEMPDGRRIFHFLGSRALGTTAATTLVAALPLDPDMLDSRGNLDSKYTALAADLQRKIIQMRTAATTPNSGIDTTGGWDQRPGTASASVNVAARFPTRAAAPNTFHPEVAYREVQLGRAAVAVGVSTDGFPLHYDDDLDAVIQVYGVGFGEGQVRRILAVFAVPGRRMVPQPRPDGAPGLLYPITVRLAALDRDQGVLRTLDTTRTFLSRDTLKGDEHLVGLLELPMPPGRYQLRALVTTPSVNAATSSGRDTVMIPESPKDLILSDLILGRSESGLSWKYAGKRISLNPLNAFPSGSDADLYYEVGGLVPGIQYGVTVAVYQARNRKPREEPLLRVSFDFTASAAYQQIDRRLGLNNLKPGAYFLEVEVAEEGSQRRDHRVRSLNILRR